MQITMADAETMALRFPYSSNAVQRLKEALPRRSWDKALKAWLVPVTDFELVLAAYPELQASPEVWEAAYPSTAKVDAETAHWCQSLANSGIRFGLLSSGAVTVKHDFAPASDLARLQVHVDERAPSIRRLLLAGRRFERCTESPVAPSAGPQVTPELLDRGNLPTRVPTSLERAYFAGIRNAAIVEERKRAMITRQRQRRFEVKAQQETMFGGEGSADE